MSKRDGERYYWMRLKSSFLDSEAVDYLMSQKDGANYVVLYQKLCLMTINTGGVLAYNLGKITVPFNIDKIVRECKHFSSDTVRVALKLYIDLELIHKDPDTGFLVINNFNELVGSETYGAIRKREKNKNLLTYNERKKGGNFPLENRDKRLEIREENKEDKTRYNEIKANSEPSFAEELFKLLVKCKYVSPNDVDKNEYIKLFEDILTYQELKDVKIKINYFIDHTCQIEMFEKQDGTKFYKRIYVDTGEIENKFLYFKKSILSSYDRKPYAPDIEGAIKNTPKKDVIDNEPVSSEDYDQLMEELDELSTNDDDDGGGDDELPF